MRMIIRLLPPALLILLCLAVLKFIHTVPFCLVFILCALYFFFLLAKSRSSKAKALFLNLGVLFLALAGAEAWLGGVIGFDPGSKSEQAAPAPHSPRNRTKGQAAPEPSGPCKMEGTYAQGAYFIDDPDRGYAAAKNVNATSKKIRSGRVIYDAAYSTNRHGLRTAPHDLDSRPRANNTDHENVLFFGCSLMVGEGVNDDQTLPWRFEKLSQGRFHAYNFGFHGYGPHQMLRIIESGLIDKIVTDKKPSFAVYLGLIGHIERAAGNYPYVLWGGRGPRYEPTPDGGLEYKGPFQTKLERTAVSLLRKSLILQRLSLFPALLGWERNDRDRERFIRIIAKSRDLLRDKYNARLYVLLWPEGTEKDLKWISTELVKRDLPRIFISDMLKLHPDPLSRYQIPGDGHPTPMAHDRLARFLLGKVKGKVKGASGGRGE